MSTFDPNTINELIRQRRAIFPKTYNDRPIPREILEEILENANHAPTHRLTEPWRFRVFRGEARQRVSDYLGAYYRQHTPPEQFSEMKYKKTVENPLRSSAVIAICLQRDPEERVPEWEELAAVAMAVQNMWLTCTAYGIGSYWSSPRSILEADEFLQLGAGERCLGLFYMGYHDMPLTERVRRPIAEKVIWEKEG